MITVRKLDKNELIEFKALVTLFNTVFKNEVTAPANDAHLNNLLKQDSFIVYAALNDEELVGGLTAYVLPQYYSNSADVYLYDLAVAASYQRKGIGNLLLDALKSYCKENDFKELFVQTESDKTTAVSFYRSTGGRALDVKHFTYNLNFSG